MWITPDNVTMYYCFCLRRDNNRIKEKKFSDSTQVFINLVYPKRLKCYKQVHDYIVFFYAFLVFNSFLKN